MYRRDNWPDATRPDVFVEPSVDSDVFSSHSLVSELANLLYSSGSPFLKSPKTNTKTQTLQISKYTRMTSNVLIVWWYQLLNTSGAKSTEQRNCLFSDAPLLLGYCHIKNIRTELENHRPADLRSYCNGARKTTIRTINNEDLVNRQLEMYRFQSTAGIQWLSLLLAG